MVPPTGTCGVVDGFTIAVIDGQQKKYGMVCHRCHQTLHDIAKRRLEAHKYGFLLMVPNYYWK